MARPLLDESHIHPAVRAKVGALHADTVREVQQAVAQHDVVVVGMAINPFPRRARRALQGAGIVVGGPGLQKPGTATSLKPDNSGRHVQDGPFADTKEQLGGTFVLDVPDLDAALEWAGKAPSVAWGGVEVRPGALYFADGQWRPNR